MGKRGPQKGAVYAKTRDKAEAREAFRRVLDGHMEALIDAQVKNAKGLSYLVARHKASGKFTKLTAEQAETILGGEDSDSVVVEVWEKDPSVQAFTDLMNRHMDKPVEAIELTGADKGPIEIVSTLAAARKGLAQLE